MRFEEKVMGGLAGFVIRYHKLIPIAGLVLFFLSIVAASNIEVRTQVKDLLPEDNPQVKSFEEVDELFHGGTVVMVTIEGLDRELMIRSAEAYAAEVRANPRLMSYVHTIDLKLDREFVSTWGLLLQEAEDLEKTGETFSALNLLPFLTSLNDSFEQTYTGEGAEEELENSRQESEALAMLNQLERFCTMLREYLENPESLPVEDRGRNLAENFVYGDIYAFSPDNSMLMFTISPNFSVMEIEKCVEMTEEIRAVQRTVQERFPEVRIGYTGDVPMQADEQEAMGFDMLVPALVALVLILLLFLFSFNQIRSILFILITLVIGIVFNYGLLGITIREITMLTSIMSVLLIGLGVDYGIQVVTNFTTFRNDGFSPAEALRNTFIKAGMGIFLAAVTTAIAFFVLAGTGSKAFGQFGFVMGTGILMCLLAMIFILPALLYWFGKKDVSRSHIPNINYDFLAGLGRFINRRHWVTLAAAMVVTAVLLVAAVYLNSMETDFMKLEPQEMPSIIQYEKVMDKYDMTPFPSMVIADGLEEARELTEALEEESMVAEVRSLALFIPSDREQEARLAEIAKIRAMPSRYISDYSYTPERIEKLAYEIQRLEWNVIEMGDLSVAGLGEDNKILAKRNRMIREIFGAEVGRPGDEVFQKLIQLIESNPSFYASPLNRLDSHFAEEMDRIIGTMAQVDRNIRPEDLPPSISRGLLEESGARTLVLAYPKPGLLNNLDNMERFNKALEKVSPRITGTTQFGIAWMEEISSASKRAALLIFAAVLLFVALSFRSLRYTLFAVVPLLVGMIWMLGVYPLLGWKLNPINIAVIPLVIGMGIDFGIHLAHRYRVERNIGTVYRYTGKGVLLSALTTMIGFGSLGLIGSFGSITSMGIILFVGLAACLTAALVVLPALLRFDSPRAKVFADNIPRPQERSVS
ncbi:MAG: MMPL family transporter [Spirochaetaceae bacterium]|nr:MAG: MMPL family transporter [Spirochaetaceae bacterium]